MTERANSLRTGLIGTIRISSIYAKTLKKYLHVDIVACGSLKLDGSRANADAYGVPSVATLEAIIASPGIDAIMNLTVQAAHVTARFQMVGSVCRASGTGPKA